MHHVSKIILFTFIIASNGFACECKYDVPPEMRKNQELVDLVNKQIDLNHKLLENINLMHFEGHLMVVLLGGNDKKLSDAEKVAKIDTLIAQGADPEAIDSRANTPLIRAAVWGETAICKVLLEKHHVNVNARNVDGNTALAASCERSSNRNVTELLLDCGADIRIRNYLPYAGLKSGNTVFTKCIYDSQRIRLLMTKSVFQPPATAHELFISQRRVAAGLWVLKKICPILPRDLMYKILASTEALWKDTCNSPFKIHKKKYNHLPFLPFSVLIQLIRAEFLNGNRVIFLLKQATIAELKPLAREAWKKVDDDERMKSLLNPDLIETHYGPDIEANIRTKFESHDCLQNKEQLITLSRFGKRRDLDIL